MRAREFIVEYIREKTAASLGNALLDAAIRDRSDEVPFSVLNLSRTMRDDDSARNKVINDILAQIETKDPTSNKQYTIWLARIYSKGNVKLEDLNRNNLLGKYHVAKKRKKIKPEHADINRFKTYREFEDTIDSIYDNFDDISDDIESDSAKADKIYEDSDVLVVIPKDEAAACKYGKGTRWCTAATDGINYFDVYNQQDPLYIIIPKNPIYPREKYQFHFKTNSFMDDQDNPVSLRDVLHERFPQLESLFVERYPRIRHFIELMPNDVLNNVIAEIYDICIDKIYEKVNDYEYDDDFYIRFLKERGYTDEEGSIDWDAVEKDGIGYLDYNTDLKRNIDIISDWLQPTAKELQEELSILISNGEIDDRTVYMLPDIMSIIIQEKLSKSRSDITDFGICTFLSLKVIANYDKNGKIYVRRGS